MVIDSSAIIAIANREDEMAGFLRAIAADPVRLVSTASMFEVFIAASRHPNPHMVALTDSLIDRLALRVEAVTPEQGLLARKAWTRFGKSRHPAALNFGDCLAYALSSATGEPLLYKGNDFAQTDVKPAL
jgi:ribonuclease VapC